MCVQHLRVKIAPHVCVCVCVCVWVGVCVCICVCGDSPLLQQTGGGGGEVQEGQRERVQRGVNQELGRSSSEQEQGMEQHASTNKTNAAALVRITNKTNAAAHTDVIVLGMARSREHILLHT
jgi:hypothetical protein